MNGHPKIESFPDRPPPLELCVISNKPGKVRVQIMNRENYKTTIRDYKDMLAAEKMAGFIAASLGVDVSNPAIWLPWLRARKFTGVSYVDALRRSEQAQTETPETVEEPVSEQEDLDEDGNPIIRAANVNSNFMK